jgi:hypothetical protein
MPNIFKGDSYFNKSEKIVAEYLSTHLPNDFTIINNFTIQQANKPYEIDSVVISSNGFFVLEIKNWFGEWRQNSGIWITNDGTITRNNPFNLLDTKARVLRSLLTEINPEYKYFSCIGFLIIPNRPEDSSFTVDRGYKKRLFRLDENLINALKGREYLFHEQAKNPSEKDVSIIIEKLTGLSEKKNNISIGNWKIEEELGIETADLIFTQYLAKHKILNKKALIKICDIPFSDKEKKNEIMLRIRKEQQALEILEGTEGILDILDMGYNGNDNSQLYIATKYTDLPLLLYLIKSQVTFTEIEIIKIFLNLLMIVKSCHEKNIIHRSISPNCIYLNPKTQDVVLSHFNLSRITIAQTENNTFAGGLPDIDYFFSAPEVIRNEGNYSFATDIYSIGKVMSILLTGKRGEIKNPKLKKIIQKCTLDNQKDRYQSGSEVLGALEFYESVKN